MKKYYRIYELIDNNPVMTDDTLVNWFDTTEHAEQLIEIHLSTKEKQYTILPVYERTPINTYKNE